MRLAWWLARRLTFRSHRSFSRLVVWLALASVALGVAVMNIAVSVVAGFEQAITQKIVGFVGDVQLSSFLAEEDEHIRIHHDPARLAAYLNELPQIAAVNPYIGSAAILKGPAGMEGVQLKGLGQQLGGSQPTNGGLRFFAESLKSGDLPRFGLDSINYSIVLGQVLAQRLGVKAGDRIRLYFLDSQSQSQSVSRSAQAMVPELPAAAQPTSSTVSANPIRTRVVRVAAVYASGLQEYDETIVLCDIRMLQRILNWEPDEYQGYDLQLGAGLPLQTRADLAEALNRRVPHDQRARSVQERHPEVFDWLALQHQNVQFILILMILLAMVNMSTTVVILITERTAAIGLMKALGATHGLVQGVFLYNAFFLIAGGVLLGNALSFGLLVLQAQTGLMKMNAESYFVNVVPVAWPWLSFVWVTAGTVGLCTLSMVLPTWLVARIQPARAVRFA
jgi:lipoprotein-releasing system permease protein